MAQSVHLDFLDQCHRSGNNITVTPPDKTLGLDEACTGNKFWAGHSWHLAIRSGR